jgi:hypothetical protein
VHCLVDCKVGLVQFNRETNAKKTPSRDSGKSKSLAGLRVGRYKCGACRMIIDPNGIKGENSFELQLRGQDGDCSAVRGLVSVCSPTKSGAKRLSVALSTVFRFCEAIDLICF